MRDKPDDFHRFILRKKNQYSGRSEFVEIRNVGGQFKVYHGPKNTATYMTSKQARFVNDAHPGHDIVHISNRELEALEDVS